MALVLLDEVLPDGITPGTRQVVVNTDAVQLVQEFPAEKNYSTRGQMSTLSTRDSVTLVVAGAPASVLATLQGE